MRFITKFIHLSFLTITLFLLLGLLIVPNHLLANTDKFFSQPIDNKGENSIDISATSKVKTLVNTGTLVLPATYWLVNQPLIFMASVYNQGHLITNPANVNIKIGSQLYPLYDNGTQGDFQANDGIYLASITHTVLGYITATLLLDDIELDTVSLNIIDDPDLLILTDWRALYWEFVDTGMAQLDEDLYPNNRHDFVDLVERINSYATNHQGIVVNLSDAITTQAGYQVDYATLNYGSNTQTRYQMGLLIDELITNLSADTLNSFANVALIGDDQVVPFYRVIDPVDSYNELNKNVPDYPSPERNYPNTVGGIQSNSTLEDSSQAYIMSDVPYSLQSHQVITQNSRSDNTWVFNPPDSLKYPRPDLGIGRIFAPTPFDLIYAIDRYENPLYLTPGSASAAIFAAKDAIDFNKVIKRSIWEEMENTFANKLQYYNAEEELFTAADFVQALGTHDLTSIFAHGSHTAMNIDSSTAILVDDLNVLTLNKAAMFTSLGCHVGYSVSNYPDGSEVKPYIDTLIEPMLTQGLAIFAPSSEAYVWIDIFAEPNIHELMLDQFINHLTQSSEQTVGEVWQAIFASYHALDPSLANDNPATHLFHTTGAYGYMLYGLPTQPIDRSSQLPPCQTVSHQLNKFTPREIEGSRGIFTMTIDTPYFQVEEKAGGQSLFRIPNGGTLLSQPTGPVLPLVIRNLSFPKNLVILGMDLVNTQTKIYSTPVTLADFQLSSANGNDVPINYTLPAKYPQKQFDYDIIDNGAEYLLSLSSVPLHYNAQSGQVTWYTQMTLAVDYIVSFPAQNPKIARIELNNNQPLQINQPRYDIVVDIEDDQARNVNIVWQLRDQQGFVVASQRIAAQTFTGTTTVTTCFTTFEWSPGQHDMLAYVEYNGNSNNSLGPEVVVQGISIEDKTQGSNVYPWHQTEATWQIQLYNELGDVVSGLAITAPNTIEPPGTGQLNFGAWLDDQPVTLNVIELEPNTGLYSVTIPLNNIVDGSHQVKIEIMDNRGIVSKHEWFVYKNLPSLTITPAMPFASETLTLAPLPDPTHVLTNTIQWYRNGKPWLNYNREVNIPPNIIKGGDNISATIELNDNTMTTLLTSNTVTVVPYRVYMPFVLKN